jgi:hypothetical protein
MCFPHLGMPYTMVLKQRTLKNGNLLLFYGLVFGKVVAYRNGMHRTANDFQWPIGQTVRDPRAKVKDHNYGLHYLASPACAPLYPAYDSHVLAVLPSPEVWDEVVLPTPEILELPQRARCWHSSGGSILECLTCANVELDVLDNPDFLGDLTKRHRKSHNGLQFSNLLATNAVWHQQVKVHLN